MDSKIIKLIIDIVGIVVIGLLCSFFTVLGLLKKEIWKEIRRENDE